MSPVMSQGDRVAVIGLGRQGLKVARGLAGQGFAIVAGCDLRAEALERFRAEFPEAAIARNVGDLAVASADVHVVATLAGAHADIVEALTGIGARRVLCEKPVANTMADLTRLRRAVVRGGLSLAVNHPRLWSDDHLRVRELVRAGTLGSLRWAEAYFKPRGFGNIGVHAISSVLFLTGRGITGVERATFAEEGALSRESGHADWNGTVTFSLDGVAFVVDNRPPRIDAPARIALGFEDGRVDLFDGTSTFRVFQRSTGVDREERTSLGWGGTGRGGDAFGRLLAAAVAPLAAGDAEENQRCAFGAAEAVIAAQVAYRERRPVTLPLPDDTFTPSLFS